jgi:hypothetical protein
MFENYIITCKPAVAVPFFHEWYASRLPKTQKGGRFTKKRRGSSNPPRDDDEICSVSSYDALFNGFHRDAVGFLLPYATLNDRLSWWDSQYFLYGISKIFYGSAVLQVPYLTAFVFVIRSIAHSVPFLAHQHSSFLFL